MKREPPAKPSEYPTTTPNPPNPPLLSCSLLPPPIPLGAVSRHWELTSSLPFQPLPAPSLLLGGFPQQQALSQDGLPSVCPERCFLFCFLFHFLFLRPPPLPPALSRQTHGAAGALSHHRTPRGDKVGGGHPAWQCPWTPRGGP